MQMMCKAGTTSTFPRCGLHAVGFHLLRLCNDWPTGLPTHPTSEQ
jgi:hypothetical protein